MTGTVAIKVLPSAALASEDDRARFYREAKAAAQLHHPHIASVFEIDEALLSDAPHGTEPSPFIAMEFIEGMTLDAKIKDGPLKLEDAIRLASEIASGLQAAHKKNIVHRDIKAANIMLDEDGKAKILDFGLAQTAASTKLTRMGSTLGTVAYMSPEQARGEEVDLRTDLWSLGVVLYEMIAGRSPFPGDYEQAVVYEILNQEPAPLTAIRTGVPMELELLVSKCLGKKASLRYQSATELLTDLKRLKIVDRTPRTMSSRIKLRSVARSPRISLPIFMASVVGATFFGALMTWMTAGDQSIRNEVRPLHFDLSLPDSIEFFDPSWSPDGTKIVFSATRGSERGFIVEYDLTTGATRQLTPPNQYLFP